MSFLESFGAWWTAAVLPWAVESTLVGVLLLAALRALRRRPPGLRLGLATLGLVKLVLPPFLAPAALLSFGVAGGGASGAPAAGTWLGAVGLLHASGVLVAGAILAQRLRELAWLRREARRVGEGPLAAAASLLAGRLGLRRCPELLVSDTVRGPCVTGLVRPAVILPARLAARATDDELRALVAHELLHLRRGDLWLGWLRAVAVALWWPSPVARALARCQEDAAEERCDDAVIGGGLAATAVYARGLASAAAAALDRPPAAPAVAALGATELERRIRRLASGPPPARSWRTAAALLVAAALVLPSIAAGRGAPAPWTTLIVFTHPDPAPPGHDHHHRHGH